MEDRQSSLGSVDAEACKTVDCCMKGKYGHKYHSHKQEDKQLNTIVDLLINSENKKDYSPILEKIAELLGRRNQGLKALENRIANLEDQLNYIKLALSTDSLKKLPKKKDIEELISKLDSEPKKIEKETVNLALEIKDSLEKSRKQQLAFIKYFEKITGQSME